MCVRVMCVFVCFNFSVKMSGVDFKASPSLDENEYMELLNYWLKLRILFMFRRNSFNSLVFVGLWSYLSVGNGDSFTMVMLSVASPIFKIKFWYIIK